MSVKYDEVITYSIIDCRDLSRAEMLGFIAADVITQDRLSEDFLFALVLGPWTINCSPELKSISYEFNKEEYYAVHFWPKKTEGIQIDYIYPAGSWSTQWSVDEVMDMLGV